MGRCKDRVPMDAPLTSAVLSYAPAPPEPVYDLAKLMSYLPASASGGVPNHHSPRIGLSGVAGVLGVLFRSRLGLRNPLQTLSSGEWNFERL